MAITHVLDHGTASDNDLDTTVARAAAANIVVGNLVIVIAAGEDSQASSCADAAGNTYAKAVDAANGSNFVAIFYGVLTSQLNSAANVTVTWPSNSRPKGITVREFTGSDVQASVLDVVAENTGTATSLTTGTTGATAQADELAVSAFVTDSNVTWTGDAAYTGAVELSDIGGAGKQEGYTQYKILTATGAQSSTVTRSAGFVDWAACIATFKAGGGGGGPAPVRMLGTLGAGT